VLLGGVLGRVSFIGGEATMMIIRDSKVAGSLIIFLSLLLLSLFCFHLMVKKGNEMMGYIIFLLTGSIPDTLSQ
jgi:hypothetical protein